MEKYNPPMSVSTCHDGVIFSASYIGWMLPILACDSCSIPTGGDPKVYCASDSLFYKIYLLQRFKTIYGGFKAGLQS